MKKNLFPFRAVVLICVAALFLNGCEKEKDPVPTPTPTVDATAPVITLNGNSDMTISLNASYTEPGATANDDVDGIVSVSISGTLDKDTKGDYTITYTASDASGNSSSATRTVHVVNDAESWAGNYSVRDSIVNDANYTYNQTITASATVNNRIHFNKFADYSNNTSTYATITVGGNTINLPSQTASSIGTLSENHSFAGNGTRSGNNFRLTYTDINHSSGGATVTCVADFTKQ